MKRDIGLFIGSLQRALFKNSSRRICLHAKAYLHAIYAAVAILRAGGYTRGLVNKVVEIRAAVFKSDGVDVGDVVALDVHSDLVGL